MTRDTTTGTACDATVMSELVDALIRERIHGFADGGLDGEWYRVGDIRFRVRPGGALQPWRHAGGPVLRGNRELTPDELLRVATAGSGESAVDQVAADLRTAVEHAAVPARDGDAESLTALRGRPFHPTARAVVGWNTGELVRYGRAVFGLDWLAVRTEAVRFGSGGWDPGTVPEMPDDARDDETLIPVHPWQLDHVLPSEFAAELAAGTVRVHARGVGRWRATSSIRTLAPVDGDGDGDGDGDAGARPARHVKLPLGVNTLGSQRLLPARYLDNGERGERLLRTILSGDEELAATVVIADETSWCGWDGDPYADRPGHLSAQVRAYPSDVDGSVPMGALASVAWHTANLTDPVPFFRRLAGDFCAMAVGFLTHGVLPEIHGQNVLRVGRRFVLRDHDTVRYCPELLTAPDPEYRVKPGAPQSLRVEDPAALARYLQTLGVQVNLYGIIDALTRTYGVPESRLWTALHEALDAALERRGAHDLRTVLFDTPFWPHRRVLAPLLSQGRSTGLSMPADTGSVPNPLHTGRLADAAAEEARHGAHRRVLNAYLRESGIHEVTRGPLDIELAATGRSVRLTVTYASPAGHHDYAAIPHSAVRAVLGELEARTGLRGTPVLEAQISGSTDNTARYLAARYRGRGRNTADASRTSEQGVLFGHPFHPTPKSAEGFDASDLHAYAPELGVSFPLRHVAVARELVHEEGQVPVPAQVTDATPPGFAAIPVHPWQHQHLMRNPAVRRLVADGALVSLPEQSPHVYPTSSVRTVCDPASGSTWKLPLHVRITNFVRHTPWEHLRRSADAMRAVAALPSYEGFGIVPETGFRTLAPAAAGHDLAAELNAVHRASTPGALVLAGLLEDPTWPAQRVTDPAEWLARFVTLAHGPLMRAFADHGVAFEAHVQNSLLRLDGDGMPARFLVRDMEGVALDRARHRDLPADSPALYHRDEAWQRLCYHAVTNQLAHVIHVLGRSSEVGERALWSVARETMRPWPEAEPLLTAPTLPAKANLLSRFAQRGERPYFVEIPNPLRSVPHREDAS
ncbi:IucA/IucC family protein [Prauserella rugosa]|uniref:Siderophore synthetase component n=1 Tax=Prauserella rugosa TaxID=43354 RepID=A0A660CHF7_9PSEU|nr:IucA/IucC family protein [Prauserella rugosa]TWH21083.1 siderophore synthetase component [Prauserella rugosa]